MTDDTSLRMTIAPGRGPVSTVVQLAAIPEEEIWLSEQKSVRTRRAYRLDVEHFMRTLLITMPEELRQADHTAVIAWERYMREVEHAASSTIRRRLAALSSLYKHLVRHTPPPATRSARSSARRSIATKVRLPPSRRCRRASCSTCRARDTVAGLRDRAIL
jgi:site-specific recombinase XerD